MTCMRPMALPALLALGALGRWGSSAAAQYVGGGTAYAPGYYFAPGLVYYAPGYDYPPRPAAGAYYDAAPAPSFRPPVLVPVGPKGRNHPASPGPLYNYGLEAESLPAQIAEDIAPARAAPAPGAPWRSGWRWRRARGRNSRSW
jgi:hypothetical protein